MVYFLGKIKNTKLPFANMVLVGAEDNDKSYNDYLNTSKGEGSIFNKSTYDTRRIVLTEMKQVVLQDINFRLLSTKTVQRRVAIRNIDVSIITHSSYIGRILKPS